MNSSHADFQSRSSYLPPMYRQPDWVVRSRYDRLDLEEGVSPQMTTTSTMLNPVLVHGSASSECDSPHSRVSADRVLRGSRSRQSRTHPERVCLHNSQRSET
jgi:hypothetical protein